MPAKFKFEAVQLSSDTHRQLSEFFRATQRMLRGNTPDFSGRGLLLGGDAVMDSRSVRVIKIERLR